MVKGELTHKAHLCLLSFLQPPLWQHAWSWKWKNELMDTGGEGNKLSFSHRSWAQLGKELDTLGGTLVCSTSTQRVKLLATGKEAPRSEFYRYTGKVDWEELGHVRGLIASSCLQHLRRTLRSRNVLLWPSLGMKDKDLFLQTIPMTASPGWY